jgi:hypothetical protein
MMMFHPLADVLPLIEGASFSELIADIKANGLHDPITTLDDQILDGRNRYRACLEANVEPRFEPFTGSDPIAFVTTKNLCRRHLNAGQRAMALAKYTTLSKGQHRPTGDTGQPVSYKTVPEIAAMAGVNKETVSDARTIHANGTAKEIASVINGIASVKAVAAAVRARRDAKVRAPPGPRLRVPDGKTVSDMVRHGITLEEGGMGLAEVAKNIGFGVPTYSTTRDVVLLARRDDLSHKDSEIAKRALLEIDGTQGITTARKMIRPIAARVWGPKGHRLKKTDERRAKQFADAIEFLKHTCENAIDMVIPHIAHDHVETAIRQLSVAEASLRKLRERIREVQHGR